MTINPADGDVLSFYTFDPKDGEARVYETYGAVRLENDAGDDPMLYTSFMDGKYINFIKMEQKMPK